MRIYGEFDFIEDIRRMFASMPNNGFEGIGDDCAVLPIGYDEALVFTSDMLNEDVHFWADKSTPYQVGYKSLMVNVSDVAAMGARPVATLLSLALPQECFGEWSEEFMRGYLDASQKHNVKLVGGDTTSSINDISISVTAIGRAPMANIKRRSAAKVGDMIFVTGRLGASAIGLRDVANGVLDSEFAKIHLMPEARVDEGEWLASHPQVHAMTDISDGLERDLQNILDESKVSAVVTSQFVPMAKGATWGETVRGGEDYELIFTISGPSIQSVVDEYEQRFGRRLYAIGMIEESNYDVHALGWKGESGVRYNEEVGGYNHFFRLLDDE